MQFGGFCSMAAALGKVEPGSVEHFSIVDGRLVVQRNAKAEKYWNKDVTDYPQVFGMAASMSGTFGYQDDLAERVTSEIQRDLRLYLDSGWPRDNYEVTRDMRARLVRRGFREGSDLLYLAFPQALHNETSWAMRAHIPFQFFFGKRPVSQPVGSDIALTSDHFLG